MIRNFTILLLILFSLQGLGQKNYLPKMVLVEGGTFEMGDDWELRNDNEKPVHKIKISTFYISKFPITVAQYKVYCQENQIAFEDKLFNRENRHHPIANVTWHNAKDYTDWLSKITGKQYRLPTEAEWEYAARGGCKSQGYKYSGGDDIEKIAWYYNNSNGQTHEVGSKKSNELGIFDMSGNVWEWCLDWYDGDYYSKSPFENPIGPKEGQFKVLRGGSWSNRDSGCRVAIRNYYDPQLSFSNYGFRVVLEEN